MPQLRSQSKAKRDQGARKPAAGRGRGGKGVGHIPKGAATVAHKLTNAQLRQTLLKMAPPAPDIWGREEGEANGVAAGEFELKEAEVAPAPLPEKVTRVLYHPHDDGAYLEPV
jgi:hypothetical protein